ncbi:tetratricopeptide repeat protein [Streptomyces sp. HPF1205]|uniref:tetratricopeptide repeat protein n=1 Tax=Streptomyces sp. HPF1205 TaxID=2873262 RepID=UPI001CED00A7|nr:tetratricopeptide repeat protein [Streptomyces sp. HPF1205]
MTGQEIDPSVRQELMSLPKTLAEDVARNLVMVARLLDEEPEQAYAYSRVALRLASRVAAVREAAGFASYATERYAEALAEFRASRRMTGGVELWPVMADCERGLGRPERALEMAGAPEVHKLDKAGQVEMRLVAAGARQDMGQAEAAVVTLQSPELASNAIHPWTARLRYAYADALLAVGRESEAREWFAKALEADHNGSTDASDRLAQLDGVQFVDVLDDEAAESEADDVREDVGSEPVSDAEDASDDEDDEDDDEDGDDDGDDDEVEDLADDDLADDDVTDDDPADDEVTDTDDGAGDGSDADDDGRPGEKDEHKGGGKDAEPASFLDSPFRAPAPSEARDED